MIHRIGIFAACLLVLIPAIAIGLALAGDAITPNDVSADELSESQLSLWGKFLWFALVMRHVGVFPFAFGVGMLALLNWNNGYASWPTWTCLILGSLALTVLSTAGLICGAVTLVAATTSRLLAPWK